jgi:DNA mismatch repair ATPase MutS
MKLGSRAVGSDVEAEGKDIVVVTGANQGGKSTYLRAVGIAQLMMQCGMFVVADSFSGNVCRQLFTHYKREEDTTMASGKLDEELNRMNAIVAALTPDSMVLFNESLTARDPRSPRRSSALCWKRA